MDRRRFVQGTAAGAAALAAPRIAAGAETRVLRFVPHADLTILDPTWTSAYVTRNHGYLVFDTLFGQNGKFQPEPQMVEGVTTGNDGRLWTLTLRSGLTFHDGEPVRGRDCVASLKRWGARDEFGKTLFAATDELSSPDDRTIVFRLKRPFPLLASALGKTALMTAAIMPERIAGGDPGKPITEMIGSGPFRYVAGERIPGDRVVYERFAGYVPRQGGTPEGTCGPKAVNFDRVEWKVIPDAATAAAALQTGEIHWWELPSADLLPSLRTMKSVSVDVLDPTGYVGVLRMNQLQAPTDNVAIRRAIMAAVSQTDVVTSVAGTDPKYWNDRLGYFCPGTTFATDAGMEAMTAPRDPDAVKRMLAAAGYKGEPIVLMRPGDLQLVSLPTDVLADTLSRAGFTVDVAAMDWGSVVQRRSRREGPGQGGWIAFVSWFSGGDHLNPAIHGLLRGDDSVLNGFCHSPAIEELRAAWSQAPSQAEQVEIARKLQLQAFAEVPYIPVGQIAQLTAYRNDLTGMLKGVPAFWNIRRG